MGSWIRFRLSFRLLHTSIRGRNVLIDLWVSPSQAFLHVDSVYARHTMPSCWVIILSLILSIKGSYCFFFSESGSPLFHPCVENDVNATAHNFFYVKLDRTVQVIDVEVADRLDSLSENLRGRGDHQPVRKTLLQKRGDDSRTAFHEHRGDSFLAEGFQKLPEVDASIAVAFDHTNVHASAAKDFQFFSLPSIRREDHGFRPVLIQEDLRGKRDLERGIHDHTQGILPLYQPAGEFGIVLEDCPRADEDAVVETSQSVRKFQGGRRADPPGTARSRGDSPIKRLGVFHGDKGVTRCHVLEKDLIQLPAFPFKDPRGDLDAVTPEEPDAFPRHPGLGSADPTTTLEGFISRIRSTQGGVFPKWLQGSRVM